MEIKLDDLMYQCPACGGTGECKIHPQSMQMVWSSDRVCPTCHGKRFVLTSQGKALAQFIDQLQRFQMIGNVGSKPWLYD